MLKRLWMAGSVVWTLFLLLEVIITGGGSNPGYWWPVLFLAPWVAGWMVMGIWRFTIYGKLGAPPFYDPRRR